MSSGHNVSGEDSGLVEAARHVEKSREAFLLLRRSSALDLSPDCARVLRNAGRVAEAEAVERQLDPDGAAR